RIIGTGPDAEAYKKLAHELKLDGNITFVGAIDGDDLVKQYNNSGFFVSSSEWESPGRAFIEAMACGIPVLLNERNNAVISADGKERMVRDGENGSIYRYGDMEDFAQKFYAMYSDANATGRMGINALSFANKNFSLARQNEGYAEEIKKAMG
ncbi:glycosyl transferase group 1, partial [mine drainage metagenome]